MTRRMLTCAGLALVMTVVTWAAPPAHAAAAEAARADWSAGPVALGTGYARLGGSLRVREVQRALTRLGYRPGPVDGLFGSRTERAAVRFQQRNGLRADAVVGRRTLRSLRARDDVRRAAADRTTATQPAGEPRRVQPLRTPVAVAEPEPGGLPLGLLALFALVGAGAVVAGLRRRVRGRPVTVQGEEIVAASPVRELAALTEAGFPARFSRPEAPERTLATSPAKDGA